MARVTFPDSEAIAIAWLAADTDVTTLAPGGISAQLSPTPTFSCLTLARIGGVAVDRRRLDAARIQVDAWGDSREHAHDLAAAARSSLLALNGVRTGGVVTGVVDDLGLSWLPDTTVTPPRPRYVCGLRMFCHATP